MSDKIMLHYKHTIVYMTTPNNIVGPSTSTALRTVTAHNDSNCKYVLKFGLPVQINSISNLVINSPRGSGGNVIRYYFYAANGIVSFSAGGYLGYVADNGLSNFVAGTAATNLTNGLKIYAMVISGSLSIQDGDTITLTADTMTVTILLSAENMTTAEDLYWYCSTTGSTYYNAALNVGGKRHTPDGTQGLPYFTISAALASLGGSFSIVTVLDSQTYDENITISGAYTIQAALGQTPVITHGVGSRSTRSMIHDGNNSDTIYVSSIGSDSFSGTYEKPKRTMNGAFGGSKTKVVLKDNVGLSATWSDASSVTMIETAYGNNSVSSSGQFILQKTSARIYGINFGTGQIAFQQSKDFTIPVCNLGIDMFPWNGTSSISMPGGIVSGFGIIWITADDFMFGDCSFAGTCGINTYDTSYSGEIKSCYFSASGGAGIYINDYDGSSDIDIHDNYFEGCNILFYLKASAYTVTCAGNINNNLFFYPPDMRGGVAVIFDGSDSSHHATFHTFIFNNTMILTNYGWGMDFLANSGTYNYIYRTDPLIYDNILTFPTRTYSVIGNTEFPAGMIRRIASGAQFFNIDETDLSPHILATVPQGNNISNVYFSSAGFEIIDQTALFVENYSPPFGTYDTGLVPSAGFDTNPVISTEANVASAPFWQSELTNNGYNFGITKRSSAYHAASVYSTPGLNIGYNDSLVVLNADTISLNGIIFDGQYWSTTGLWESAAQNALSIKWCQFKKFGGMAIDLYATTDATTPITIKDSLFNKNGEGVHFVSSSGTIERSAFYRNIMSGIYEDTGGNSASNCIFFKNGYGLYLYSTAISFDIIDSIFHENLYYGIYSDSLPINPTFVDLTDSFSATVGAYSSGLNLSSDPLFVSVVEDAENFRLQTVEDGFGKDSPCKNSSSDGTDLGCYTETRELSEDQWKTYQLDHNPKSFEDHKVQKGLVTFQDGLGSVDNFALGIRRQFTFSWEADSFVGDGTLRKKLEYIQGLVKTRANGLTDDETMIRLHLLPDSLYFSGSGTIDGTNKFISPTIYPNWIENEHSGRWVGVKFIESTDLVINATAKTGTRSSASWTVDQWAGYILYWNYKYFRVISNTATILTFSDAYNELVSGTIAVWALEKYFKILENDESSLTVLDDAAELPTGSYSFYVDFYLTRSVNPDFNYLMPLYVADKEFRKTGFQLLLEEI